MPSFVLQCFEKSVSHAANRSGVINRLTTSCPMGLIKPIENCSHSNDGKFKHPKLSGTALRFLSELFKKNLNID